MNREDVLLILSEAEKVDSEYTLFGADEHKYKLNPPLEIMHINKMEEKYCFTLPSDYLKYITETGDGGAGPGYGLYPFSKFEDPDDDRYPVCNMLPNNICKPFCPHNASHEEILKCEITEYYKQNRKNIFCYYDNEDHKYVDGFLVLGHLGCGIYYIMPVQGENNGKIFVTTLEDGYYYLLEDSFMQFYNKWFLKIKDALKKESLEQKRDALRNVYV